MKRQLVALLATFILCFCLAACAGTTESVGFETESAVGVLENVWDNYTEDDRFPVMGGDWNENIPDMPAKFDHTNIEYMEQTMCVPIGVATMVDDAASMIHMLNVNTFTAGAYHLADVANEDAFAASVREQVQAKQWLCGMPERHVILSDGNGYIVSVFGLNEAIEPFIAKVIEMGGTIVVDEPITEGPSFGPEIG